MSIRSFISLLLIAAPLAAQHGQPPVNPYDLRGLTKEPGPNEPRFTLEPAPTYRAVPALRANPVAPRMIAEWEKVQGALVRYPLGISVDAVKAIASELKTYVLCASSSQTAARTAFQNGGVNLSNIVFVNATTDTYWTRDYGPWWITAEENGKRVVRMVDVVYRPNGERPNDDRVPQVLASQLQLSSSYNLTFVCQGGNVMTDSLKVGASTDRLRDENSGLSETQLKQMASTTVGFNTYYIPTDPGYPKDYIKHIDCWAKFINPTTVLVKRVPSSDSYYSNYEAAADQWRNRTNAAGQKYTVIRIDGSADAPYVNHVILNDRVFVPVLTSETDAADKAALDQIRAAYGSGYRIIGVKAAPGLPWLGTDSIHCRVNSIPVFSGLADQGELPLAVSSLANQTVADGTSVTFTASASGGTAPYAYQWLKNGAVVNGATAAVYTFTASAATTGRYSVKVTDAKQATLTSNEATLALTTGDPKEIILNGGFESGATSWTGTSGAIGNWSGSTYNEPAYAGVNAAFLGGNGKTSTETLYQTVTIPTTAASATLSFYLHIDTKESGSTVYDKLAIQVRNSAGTVLNTLATYSNANAATGYQMRSFDLSAYKGQTVRIHFNMTEDSALATNFLIDQVSLRAQ